MQQQQAANENEYIKCANGRAHRGDDGTAERTPGNDAISLLGATFLGVFLILCIRMGQAQLANDAIKNLA